jgi:5-methylcytosine-specific restriction endonuclease McrA
MVSCWELVEVPRRINLIATMRSIHANMTDEQLESVKKELVASQPADFEERLLGHQCSNDSCAKRNAAYVHLEDTVSIEDIPPHPDSTNEIWRRWLKAANSRYERRVRYRRYLESTAWGRIRARALQRDNNQCQAQLTSCSNVATDVHHLTYRFIGSEPLFDLISVCRACHESIESMKGERGIDL